MRTPRTLSTLAFVGAVAIGCTNTTTKPNDGFSGSVSATLRRMKSCADLETELKADVRAKMNERIDAMIEMYTGSSTPGGAPGRDMSAGPSSGSGEASSTPPATPAPGGAGASKGSDSAGSFSETTTQVKGVDEADFVKTDGKNIYLLHGQSFMVLKAWPADSLANASSLEIEGQPTEMFVADGKVVVYSRVDGTKIYDAAGVKPRPYYVDTGWGSMGVRTGGAPTAPPSGGAMWPGGGGWLQNALTKVTVLSLVGDAATVARELYFEGSYLSSRRVGTKVRTVLSGGGHGPQLNFDTNSKKPILTNKDLIAVLEQRRAENNAVINASKVSDWLPYYMSKVGGKVTAANTACEDYYVPTAGSTEFGLTQVSALDLGAVDAPPTAAVIVGNADTVYSNADTMYVAAHAWLNSRWTKGGYASTPDGMTMNWTHVHKFDFGSGAAAPSYRASGTIPGNVINQFALDENKSVLRIATTENRFARSMSATRTVNNLFTMTEKKGVLELTGDVGELAKNERIFSVRFVGDRGYVVTFRQVDPLFVIDLKDPAKPTVLAALKIPGFSNYMHPLDEGHLLTIGRDADDGGRQRGLSLQIFDVTNPRDPKLAHKVVFDGTRYGTSEAAVNHKAFTYFEKEKLLAFPYISYGGPSMRSSLEVFSIDTTTGITQLGSVDHTPLFSSAKTGYCGGYFTPQVRRGLFLDRVVYSISYGGVVASNVDDLATPLKTLALPRPTISFDPRCGGKGG